MNLEDNITIPLSVARKCVPIMYKEAEPFGIKITKVSDDPNMEGAVLVWLETSIRSFYSGNLFYFGSNVGIGTAKALFHTESRKINELLKKGKD